MWSWPDGYGSISRTYVFFRCASSSSGGGFGVENARSSAHTRCHFGSIVFGSYRSTLVPPETKKPLVSREAGGSCRGGPRSLPALQKKLLHYGDSSSGIELTHPHERSRRWPTTRS